MGFRASEEIKKANAEMGWNMAKYILQNYGANELIYALENYTYVESTELYLPTVIEDILAKRGEK